MITKPTLLIDEKKCRKNISQMVAKAQNNKVVLRPHFKTHQSLEIGRWFKEAGVTGITVSSLEMAKYFSEEWNDITVAFPLNILEIETINQLAEKIDLNILIESKQTIGELEKKLKFKVGFFIKVDVGTHRTGMNPENTHEIDELLDASDSTELLTFKGFLAHAGHSYNCRSKQAILEVHENSIQILEKLKAQYTAKYPELILSTGDTPSCSVAGDFSGVDEIRPGNFVFYDLTQVQIGACTVDQVSVALACPIVAVHEDRNEIVVYGGGVHFSKEQLQDETHGTIFGKIVQKEENGWGKLIKGMYLRGLSQEHGIVTVPEDEIKKYRIGDYLIALPVHSCMTANLMREYLTTDSKWLKE